MSVEALVDAWQRSPYDDHAIRHVHLVIANTVNAQNHHRFWMNRTAIAQQARVSRGTVDAALRRMVDDGWLTVVEKGGGRGKPTTYEYHFGGLPETAQPLRGLEPETAQSATDTAQPGEIRPSTERKERSAEASEESTTATAGPTTTAWNLAKARIEDGQIVRRGAKRLATVVQAALDAEWTETEIREALASLRGVPIETGNLTVACSQVRQRHTAERRAHDEAPAGPWWEQEQTGRRW